MRRRLAFATAVVATLLVADVAQAAGPSPDSEPGPPAGTVAGDPATSGSTELEGQGSFGSVAENDEEAGDALEWDLSLGALLSTGNARSTALTGGSTFRLRRSRHQFSAFFLGNYGRAATSADAEPRDTIGNLQGRVRYDFFLGDRWSLFGMVTARHDPFQLLDLRLNVDPGAAFYIINRAKEQLHVEAGYDFQYDDPSDAAVERTSEGDIVYDAQGGFTQIEPRNVHALRLAGGYANSLSETVTFATDLEYLQSVQDAQRWRLNWYATLSAQLVAQLSLAATFSLRMDNDPVAVGVKNLDTNTSVNLVYRFF